jgi:D-methionine transport system ATP-binding protein
MDVTQRVLVELDNIYVESDRAGPVFNNLCFRLTAGYSAVITGPSGSGKTTLTELVVGSRFAQSGSVEVFGKCLRPGQWKTIKRVRRKIGGVGGMFTLIPSFTVAENIGFPLVLAGVRRKTRQERLLKMLTEFSLVKRAGDYPRTLTRVESTLVQFARASVAHQPLLIIDEPLAGLDRQTFRRILEHLVAVSLSGRSMIILTSEVLPHELPNTDYYLLGDGTLS